MLTPARAEKDMLEHAVYRERLTDSLPRFRRPIALEEGLRAGNITGDLRLEGIEGGEFHFIAEFFDERDFHFLAVKIAREIQQMSFDAKLRLLSFKRRPAADIEHGSIVCAPGVRMDGINPGWRENQSRNIEIGRRKPELAAKL